MLKTNRADNKVGRFMVASGAVIELGETGKILLLKRSNELDWQPGEWEIMYGRIDQFESPEEGLRREVVEETGLENLEIIEILSVWHIYRGGEKKVKNDLVGITYRCRTQTEKVKISSEHSDYKWVEPKEALKMIKIEGIAGDVKKYLEVVSK